MAFLHHLGGRCHRQQLGQGVAQTLGYCSEITTGSSSSAVAASSQRPAPGAFGVAHGADELFLDVDDQQRGLVWIDQHALPCLGKGLASPGKR